MFIAVAAILGWRFGAQNNWFRYAVLPLALVTFAYEYLTTVSGVTIAREYLHIKYPTFQRICAWKDIDSVRLGNLSHEGAKYPQLLVESTQYQKTFRLRGLGVTAVELYRIVLAVWKGESNAQNPAVAGHAAPLIPET